MKISIQDVSFTYPSGLLALRNVNLEIESGESIAILGENGAGKTTLARHINGLLRPTDGSVLLGNRDTRGQSVAQLSRWVGFVFQNPDDQLFERTVFGEVAFGPRNLGLEEGEVETRVLGALGIVGLEDVEKQHPYDLHISKRRLVALAATLAMNTPIIILDEPTNAHDALGVAKIGEIVEMIKAERRTVIIISHDVDFVAEHFSRVVLMAGGQILADKPAEDVFVKRSVLAEAGIEAPQLLRLSSALGMKSVPLTVDAFLEAYSKR